VLEFSLQCGFAAMRYWHPFTEEVELEKKRKLQSYIAALPAILEKRDDRIERVKEWKKNI